MNAPRETTSKAVRSGAIVAAAIALAVAWTFDLTVLRTPVLTHFVAGGQRIPAATPVYAFWMPVLRPHAALFVAVAALLVALTPRLVEPSRTRRSTFALALAAAAVLVPLALFLVRQPLGELGKLLTIYRNEEVLADALRIRDYAPFLRNYVEWMPQMSLHGKHFPPGHASWIYAVVQAFGPGTLPVAIATLCMFAAGVTLWYAAFRRIADERAARTGALLLLACPSLVDFACTSMDAVLFGAAGLSAWLAARTVAELTAEAEPRGSARLLVRAALTGAALFLATFLSFSAFPLGLMIGLFVLVAGRKKIRRAALAVLAIGVGFSACGLALWAASGFSMVACLLRAIELNEEFMSHVVKRDVHELYGYLVYGNAAGFAIGAGAALVAAAASRLAAGKTAWTSFAVASAATLAVMMLGGIYFMETERIWMYAMPWLAGLVAASGAIEDRSLRVLIGVGMTQALAMEVALLTLW